MKLFLMKFPNLFREKKTLKKILNGGKFFLQSTIFLKRLMTKKEIYSSAAIGIFTAQKTLQNFLEKKKARFILRLSEREKNLENIFRKGVLNYEKRRIYRPS